jgi:hypothetical protein
MPKQDSQYKLDNLVCYIKLLSKLLAIDFLKVHSWKGNYCQLDIIWFRTTSLREGIKLYELTYWIIVNFCNQDYVRFLYMYKMYMYLAV